MSLGSLAAHPEEDVPGRTLTHKETRFKINLDDVSD